MRRVNSEDASFERKVRSALHKRGLRFRLRYSLPVKAFTQCEGASIFSSSASSERLRQTGLPKPYRNQSVVVPLTSKTSQSQ